jgi:hypothetical protein
MATIHHGSGRVERIVTDQKQGQYVPIKAHYRAMLAVKVTPCALTKQPVSAGRRGEADDEEMDNVKVAVPEGAEPPASGAR